MSERLFLDTAFIQALLNRRDQYHQQARQNLPRFRAAAEVWTTEAILIEVANALASVNRLASAQFIRQCFQTNNIRVVPVSTSLFNRGLEFYETRSDKMWELTDCISFVVMEEEGITLAMTTDRHFIQAGFRALLLENQ